MLIGYSASAVGRWLAEVCSEWRHYVLLSLQRCCCLGSAFCGLLQVYAMALCPSVSVCLCLSLSVTSRCSSKTNKCRIKQTTPDDSPGSLVFWRQRSPRNSTGAIPYGGRQMQVGWVKVDDFRPFDKLLAISRKRYEIDAQFLLKSNRKLYALYRMVTLPMTLSDPWVPKLLQFVHFTPFLLSSQ